ncbi:shikimate dehydrogenase [Cyanobium sp. LEGE 06113]|uniref:shikimate dehydrogenase n=1 Tax=Cyanobium sp. LEGE 06113 TaxID=1297573 RepID=UPI00187EE0AD|nr:shikimate dehydrogenase [Cyanobium sp. LEGE 06113]MBE9154825.1 shikimate dehydrogenase [Cyanobium sp. LEGE 06113]
MAPPISASTALVGVLGDPVRHSLSPAMHNAALAALGLDWIYLALPTPAESLAAVVGALEALDCRGLNVTLPHKQAVAPLCAELSPLAARVGAVNTLVRRSQGGWLGTNTDVEGFLAPLRPAGSWQGSGALVLGCGGSARAVVAGLVELGCASIQVVGRRAAGRQALLEACRSWAPQLGGSSWEELPALLPASQLVVNTTPVGMASPGQPAAALACPLEAAALAGLGSGCWVYDLIYTPRPSALLRAAAERGCHGIDGLEMLVQQGAAALRLWSGREAVPVEAMRAAAERALAGTP